MNRKKNAYNMDPLNLLNGTLIKPKVATDKIPLIKDDRNQKYKPTRGKKVTFTQSIPIVQDSSSLLNGLD